MLKILTRGCEPTKGSKYSAGIDLYASEDVIIGTGETKLVGLGVCIDLEKYNKFLSSHYLELHPRSSLRAKGLISNTGIIDLDYKDEIKIIIHNPLNGIANRGAMNQRYFTIKKGDRIAQILLKEHKGYLLGVMNDDERTGGFGSTN